MKIVRITYTFKFPEDLPDESCIESAVEQFRENSMEIDEDNIEVINNEDTSI